MGKVLKMDKARKETRSASKVSVTMKRVKETKGAYQYKEVDDDGEVIEDFNEVKIGSIYIRKDALDGAKGPKEITVTASW